MKTERHPTAAVEDKGEPLALDDAKPPALAPGTAAPAKHPKRRRRKSNPAQAQGDQDAADMYRLEKMSVPEIARRQKVSQPTVLRRLDRRAVERRSISAAKLLKDRQRSQADKLRAPSPAYDGSIRAPELEKIASEHQTGKSMAQIVLHDDSWQRWGYSSANAAAAVLARALHANGYVVRGPIVAARRRSSSGRAGISAAWLRKAEEEHKDGVSLRKIAEQNWQAWGYASPSGARAALSRELRKNKQPSVRRRASKAEKTALVLAALNSSPRSQLAISINTGLPLSAVVATLGALEAEGKVRRLPWGGVDWPGATRRSGRSPMWLSSSIELPTSDLPPAVDPATLERIAAEHQTIGRSLTQIAQDNNNWQRWGYSSAKVAAQVVGEALRANGFAVRGAAEAVRRRSRSGRAGISAAWLRKAEEEHKDGVSLRKIAEQNWQAWGYNSPESARAALSRELLKRRHRPAPPNGTRDGQPSPTSKAEKSALVLAAFSGSPRSQLAISIDTGLPRHSVVARLRELEAGGAVRRLPWGGFDWPGATRRDGRSPMWEATDKHSAPDSASAPKPTCEQASRLGQLLDHAGQPAANSPEHDERGATLVQALDALGRRCRLVGEHRGAVVTLYELELAPGTKVSQVSSVRDDIAYALAAEQVRVLAPIPGRKAVGVEVANQHRRTVHLADVLGPRPVGHSPLTVWLGETVEGKTASADLATLPHLLVAGTTGAGKSVALNSMLLSILLGASTEEVNLVLVDTKRVEFTHFTGIPHLHAPIVTSPDQAREVLDELVATMEERYDALAQNGARDLTALNLARRETGEIPLPYLLFVVDELADLMMTAPAQVEQAIIRLAQKARAVGIHLILASQSPRVDVITAQIKANMPARLALRVASMIDSRVILDRNGAELLLGAGDMLFAPNAAKDPQRIQGALVTTQEVTRIVTALRAGHEPDPFVAGRAPAPAAPELVAPHSPAPAGAPPAPTPGADVMPAPAGAETPAANRQAEAAAKAAALMARIEAGEADHAQLELLERLVET